MKARIRNLNALYTEGKIGYWEYRSMVDRVLSNLDWMRAIKYRNMTLV